MRLVPWRLWTYVTTEAFMACPRHGSFVTTWQAEILIHTHKTLTQTERERAGGNFHTNTHNTHKRERENESARTRASERASERERENDNMNKAYYNIIGSSVTTSQMGRRSS